MKDDINFLKRLDELSWKVDELSKNSQSETYTKKYVLDYLKSEMAEKLTKLIVISDIMTESDKTILRHDVKELERHIAVIELL